MHWNTREIKVEMWMFGMQTYEYNLFVQFLSKNKKLLQQMYINFICLRHKLK